MTTCYTVDDAVAISEFRELDDIVADNANDDAGNNSDSEVKPQKKFRLVAELRTQFQLYKIIQPETMYKIIDFF